MNAGKNRYFYIVLLFVVAEISLTLSQPTDSNVVSEKDSREKVLAVKLPSVDETAYLVLVNDAPDEVADADDDGVIRRGRPIKELGQLLANVEEVIDMSNLDAQSGVQVINRRRRFNGKPNKSARDSRLGRMKKANTDGSKKLRKQGTKLQHRKRRYVARGMDKLQSNVNNDVDESRHHLENNVGVKRVRRKITELMRRITPETEEVYAPVVGPTFETLNAYKPPEQYKAKTLKRKREVGDDFEGKNVNGATSVKRKRETPKINTVEKDLSDMHAETLMGGIQESSSYEITLKERAKKTFETKRRAETLRRHALVDADKFQKKNIKSLENINSVRLESPNAAENQDSSVITDIPLKTRAVKEFRNLRKSQRSDEMEASGESPGSTDAKNIGGLRRNWRSTKSKVGTQRTSGDARIGLSKSDVTGNGKTYISDNEQTAYSGETFPKKSEDANFLKSKSSNEESKLNRKRRFMNNDSVENKMADAVNSDESESDREVETLARNAHNPRRESLTHLDSLTNQLNDNDLNNKDSLLENSIIDGESLSFSKNEDSKDVFDSIKDESNNEEKSLNAGYNRGSAMDTEKEDGDVESQSVSDESNQGEDSLIRNGRSSKVNVPSEKVVAKETVNSEDQVMEDPEVATDCESPGADDDEDRKDCVPCADDSEDEKSGSLHDNVDADETLSKDDCEARMETSGKKTSDDENYLNCHEVNEDDCAPELDESEEVETTGDLKSSQLKDKAEEPLKRGSSSHSFDEKNAETSDDVKFHRIKEDETHSRESRCVETKDDCGCESENSKTADDLASPQVNNADTLNAEQCSSDWENSVDETSENGKSRETSVDEGEALEKNDCCSGTEEHVEETSNEIESLTVNVDDDAALEQEICEPCAECEGNEGDNVNVFDALEDNEDEASDRKRRSPETKRSIEETSDVLRSRDIRKDNTDETVSNDACCSEVDESEDDLYSEHCDEDVDQNCPHNWEDAEVETDLNSLQTKDFKARKTSKRNSCCCNEMEGSEGYDFGNEDCMSNRKHRGVNVHQAGEDQGKEVDDSTFFGLGDKSTKDNQLFGKEESMMGADDGISVDGSEVAKKQCSSCECPSGPGCKTFKQPISSAPCQEPCQVPCERDAESKEPSEPAYHSHCKPESNKLREHVKRSQRLQRSAYRRKCSKKVKESGPEPSCPRQCCPKPCCPPPCCPKPCCPPPCCPKPCCPKPCCPPPCCPKPCCPKCCPKPCCPKPCCPKPCCPKPCCPKPCCPKPCCPKPCKVKCCKQKCCKQKCCKPKCPKPCCPKPCCPKPCCPKPCCPKPCCPKPCCPKPCKEKCCKPPKCCKPKCCKEKCCKPKCCKPKCCKPKCCKTESCCPSPCCPSPCCPEPCCPEPCCPEPCCPKPCCPKPCCPKPCCPQPCCPKPCCPKPCCPKPCCPKPCCPPPCCPKPCCPKPCCPKPCCPKPCCPKPCCPKPCCPQPCCPPPCCPPPCCPKPCCPKPCCPKPCCPKPCCPKPCCPPPCCPKPCCPKPCCPKPCCPKPCCPQPCCPPPCCPKPCCPKPCCPKPCCPKPCCPKPCCPKPCCPKPCCPKPCCPQPCRKSTRKRESTFKKRKSKRKGDYLGRVY